MSKQYQVVIHHSDWYSMNERTYNIDLKDYEKGFKLLINHLKKQTKLAVKEAIHSVHVDFSAVTPIEESFAVDKRYIIEYEVVREMVFMPCENRFTENRVVKFDSIVKSTNYVYSCIHNELMELYRKELGVIK